MYDNPASEEKKKKEEEKKKEEQKDQRRRWREKEEEVKKDSSEKEFIEAYINTLQDRGETQGQKAQKLENTLTLLFSCCGSSTN